MSRTQRTKVGVIGVGHLGQHHAKHFSQLPHAELIGVYDIDQSRAQIVAERYGTTAYPDLDLLLRDCEAVSVVTPTRQHAVVAKQCIEAGKHVFIEKPITKTVAEADLLLTLAEQHKVLIQVGHIERLNPALLALKDLSLNPKFIEIQRLAPYNVRGTDVPVVLDLMIHDIDILLALVNSPVKNMHASGVSIMTDSVDIANVRIRFQNGTVANLTSSRVAKDKVRKIKIFQKDLYITIDFLLGLTEVYRVLEAHEKDPQAIMTAPFVRNGTHKSITYEKPPVKKIDALRMELANFIASVQGRETPIVDGKAGREALDVAIRIHDMIIEDIL
ncbi:MAG: Gfo/Idh/MocA family oxidoreductase [FCB group bacterium]|nr:Gfo/Idh/MocA family oxidoreductase [FCB group bacterium]